MKFNLQELKRLLTFHYVGNILLGVIYYVLRLTHPTCVILFPHAEEECALDWTEWQIVFFLAVIVTYKNKKQPNWIAYISNTCMYSKVVHLILFFRQDPKYSIMYGIICIVHHVLCPEASFKGPENITYFRGPHLEDEIKKDSRMTWIVAFYAAWSPDCISFASTFATMSIKYSLPNLKFGKMDASRYSIVAERFRIDVSPTSKQLPTVIVFQGGREKRRRPYIDYNGKVTRFVMAEEYLIKDLELNQIYEDCKKNPIKMRTKVKVEKKEETPAEGVPPPAEEKGSEEKKND